ncbi:MAG: metal-dependent hydrolase [Methanobacteriota archaeon]|nr:MAG: metal-dependent hydrolase [Euryarchaeota archaeon]
MKRITHALSGAAVGASVSLVTGEHTLSLAAIGAVAGVVPDVDAAIPLLSRRIHRSAATHSVLAAAMLALAWVVVLSGLSHLVPQVQPETEYVLSSGLAVFASAFVHAVEDSLTVAGSRLFYPFSRRRWRGPVKYDDPIANAALSAAAAVALVLIAGSHW